MHPTTSPLTLCLLQLQLTLSRNKRCSSSLAPLLLPRQLPLQGAAALLRHAPRRLELSFEGRSLRLGSVQGGTRGGALQAQLRGSFLCLKWAMGWKRKLRCQVDRVGLPTVCCRSKQGSVKATVDTRPVQFIFPLNPTALYCVC